MAYLTQLDAQLLLFIHDALHHEPLHNFWAGISFLGDLGWFWIFTAAVLIINRGGAIVKHICQQCYLKKRRYAPTPV